MPLIAALTTTEVALVCLVAIPAVLVVSVLLVLLVVVVAAAVLMGSGWALTRASARVLGGGEEIWR